jgi:LL-diaminopimelate aminotransferase
MAENDFRARGCDIADDEIFISDGAKSDSANIQEIFTKNTKIAVCDPVYPVYVDSNVMAGRCGEYDSETGVWNNVIYMPCTAENGFAPQLPKEKPDLIYLCFPNNPTGSAITKDQLQVWVDYANRNGAVIIFDAAYEAYISEDNIPHSIYGCEGARTCAIELRSFSKNAGFTGLRLGATIIPHDLKVNQDGQEVELHRLWARRHGTKYNGAPYIVQRAGEACYSEAGKAQIKEMVGTYMKNAAYILNGLNEAGYEAYGGVNSPYVWLKTPGNMTSWEFFDHLLEKANVVGTPGSGFGPSGEHYFRLTAFGSYANSVEALERIKKL